MTHSPALVLVGLRVGRWILPLVALVFVPATLVYAISRAIARGASAQGLRPNVEIAVATGDATGPAADERSSALASAQSADPSPVVSPVRCTPLSTPYVDSSIVAEIRKIDCRWAP